MPKSKKQKKQTKRIKTEKAKKSELISEKKELTLELLEKTFIERMKILERRVTELEMKIKTEEEVQEEEFDETKLILLKILKKLAHSSPDIKSSAIINLEGLLIVDTLPKTVDKLRVSIINTLIFICSKILMKDFMKGEPLEITIKGTTGHLITMLAGKNIMLTSKSDNIKLGTGPLDMKRAVKEIISNLKEYKSEIPKNKISNEEVFEIINTSRDKKIIKSTETKDLCLILKNLVDSSSQILASMIFILNGLPVATHVPKNSNIERLTEGSAVLVYLAGKLFQELFKGELLQIIIRGTEGYLLLVPLLNDIFLDVLVDKNVKLGLISLDITKATKNIIKLLKNFSPPSFEAKTSLIDMETLLNNKLSN